MNKSDTIKKGFSGKSDKKGRSTEKPVKESGKKRNLPLGEELSKT